MFPAVTLDPTRPWTDASKCIICLFGENERVGMLYFTSIRRRYDKKKTTTDATFVS